MKLREAAMNIKTNWREIIIKLLDLYPEIENVYKMDYIHLDGVHKIYPETENIFNCFNYFNVEDTKVVILGQDPYHGEGQANGLAFAVNSDIKIPPSLRNILKKLDKPLVDRTLTNWAEQGILLLNCALTVKEKTPRSYLKLWKSFTISILGHVAKYSNNTVFVSWGGFAFDIYANVQPDSYPNKNHKLMVCSHPSPLGCNKKMQGNPSFNEYNTFMEVNKFLGEKRAIIW
jgi:uracil-DNA glycosylase